MRLRLFCVYGLGTKQGLSEFDPATSLMDLSLYRQHSAIHEWMEKGRSNAPPTMDEDSEFSDTPLPIKEWTNIAAAHGDTDHAAD